MLPEDVRERREGVGIMAAQIHPVVTGHQARPRGAASHSAAAFTVSQYKLWEASFTSPKQVKKRRHVFSAMSCESHIYPKYKEPRWMSDVKSIEYGFIWVSWETRQIEIYKLSETF